MHENLKRTKNGYWKCSTSFNKENLKKLYEEYYPNSNKKQTVHNYYKLEYSNTELLYIKNDFDKINYLNDKFNESPKKSFLDIGCGEGHSLSFFQNKYCNITGIDFTKSACQLQNNNMADNIIVGDFYKVIDTLNSQNKKFDFVICMNVLEHVLDAEGLLQKVFNLLNDGGILVIKVPNDFSILQSYLIDNNYVDNQYWVVLPDHLNYFSLDSLKNTVEDLNFKVVHYYSDFPIDINLLNEDTNYIKNPILGKKCALARMELENLISSISIEKSIELGKNFADIGLGRNITLIAKK